jgi:hypothetical protein
VIYKRCVSSSFSSFLHTVTSDLKSQSVHCHVSCLGIVSEELKVRQDELMSCLIGAETCMRYIRDMSLAVFLLILYSNIVLTLRVKM